MNVYIVESPFSHPTVSRDECLRYALWCCRELHEQGAAAFASHLFFTQFIPETKEGRAAGLAYRDEIARRVMGTVVRFTDLGLTPGMFRDIDCTGEIVERQLTGSCRDKWLAGEWPEGSIQCSTRKT